jgi:ribosomal protein S18 acetylase RimI-like enzyme
MDIVIQTPSESHRPEWNDLWDAYLTFYETEISRKNSDVLWGRIQDPQSGISCHIAVQQGRLIGLVHFLSHSDTWDSRPICYLQDLYVHESYRGRGVGELLIRAVVDDAERNGWSGVYWLTAEDNERARGLYDRLAGGPSGFIVYNVQTTISSNMEGTG